jgi:hypothetical protein
MGTNNSKQKDNRAKKPPRGRPSRKSRACIAREQAGISVVEAASRAEISVAYLRRKEIHGSWPYALAVRLSKMYGVSCQIFLYR